MKCRLLVEGPDEMNVIWRLLEVRGYHRLQEPAKSHKAPKITRLQSDEAELEILEAGSKDQVLQSISVTWKAEWPHNLGAVLDWDFEFEKQTKPWPSLRARILKATDGKPLSGLPSELELPPRDGLVMSDDDGRRLGAWIMPDNENKGTLETFVSTMIRPGNALALWEKAQADVAAIPMKLFGETKHHKACMHTWLAWQEEPGLPMRIAIRAKYLEAYSPAAQALVN